MRILFCSSYTIRLFSKICWTKYVFPLCVGPTTKSENLWRKLNSGHGLVTMDAVTFRAAFVGCRTEQVFLRTHLFSSTVCVGHPGSEPEQCLCERTWPFLATFSFHHRINDVLDVNDYSYTEELACHRQDSLFCAYRAS